MFINLYKPSGVSSYDCIRIIKFIFKYPEKFADNNDWQKIIKEYKGGTIGHAGTLDPFADGVLIVCTDQDTKSITDIQNQPKEYQTIIKLGASSNTYDIEGIITPQKNKFIPTQSAIIEVIKQSLIGEINQYPPSFSAKKINGQRAYQLARQNISVKLSPKKVIIYNIDVNDYAHPDLQLTIKCSSGTYIRSIAHDLGQLLQTGAYCHSLSRLAIGTYRYVDSIPLPQDQIAFFQNKYISKKHNL
ncbi:MAG TPA: tRNA pseudouridine(55) synthase TruB [bacterium]|nr:tRNA pseudouridine(55) synthase TruB [bacterium]